MKKVKYFIFSLICLFSCCMVYAESQVVIKSITPVYDENSGVVVTNKNNQYGVIFNDKAQSVKYKVVLKNTTNREIYMNKVELSKPTEDFLEYTFDVNSKDDYLKANETKEVILTLETVKKEGWGRNFDDTLTATFNFEQAPVNPNTSTGKNIVICLVVLTAGAMVIVFRKNKTTKYIVLIFAIGSSLAIINAKESIELTINTKASFESKNIIIGKAQCEWIVEEDEDEDDGTWEYEECDGLWAYRNGIKNIYIENEFREIKDFAYKFDISEEQNGVAYAYLVPKEEEEDYYYDLYLQSDGIMYFGSDASRFFAYMDVDSINNLDGLDTSKVTNMNGMFYNTGSDKLTSLDLSSFDTSNVTNMSEMFHATGSESDSFSLDISSFDTSKVTDMSGMFGCVGDGNPNFTLDLSHFDTSNVTNMSYMFERTGDDSTGIPLDLSSFDTSNVIDMSYMFSYTSFTLDFSNFDTSNVTNMERMFWAAGYSNPNFTLDLSSFDTSNVTNMKQMFWAAGGESDSFILNLGNNFDTSKVTTMFGMFSETGGGSDSFTLDLGDKFDTSNVTDMYGMFERTGRNSLIFTLDLGDKFDTSNVTDMIQMFGGTGYSSEIFTLDLGDKFDTSKITNMYSMFSSTGYSSEIFTLDLGDKFDTSNVTDMSNMFNRAGYKSPVFTLDLGDKFDTSKVTNMDGMFNRMGYSSNKLNTSITIKNPNLEVDSYSYIFTQVAMNPGTKIILNYTSKTGRIVDMMIEYKSEGANVFKGELVEMITDDIAVGDELAIGDEHFNVISQTDDTVTMLAKYNLGTNYKQSTDENYVNFSSEAGWEYTPGPKEINIQTWSTNPKTYVNEYVSFLQNETGDSSLTGDLITLKQLKDLGCRIPDDYGENYGGNNSNLTYGTWLVNGQKWWTRSATPESSDNVWVMREDEGNFYHSEYNNSYGVRPVITISREILKNIN